MTERKQQVARLLGTSHHLDGFAGKYLAFMLSKAEYGVQILKVREIIGIIDITVLPGVPAYVKGVINLRGRIIPVVDLRLRFGLAEVPHGPETCIIVVEIERPGDDDVLQMGCIVDTVCEVVQFARDQLDPAPRGTSIGSDYVLALGTIEERMVILLDIDKVVGIAEVRER